MACKPCCCYSLKFSAILVGIWTILYGLVSMAVFAWRTAEISYKRERMLGTIKPWDYNDVRDYPGTYNIYYRSPEITWYTAIFVLVIIKCVAGFFLIAGGVTLIWGVKAVIFWLVWFWVVVISIDICVSFGYAIAWWTSQIRPQEQQVALPAFEIIFVLINLYCLWIVFLAYRAMKRGEFSLKKKQHDYSFVNPPRQVVVDHSYDYDPFGAVFIDPYEKPKKHPPPYYTKEEYSVPVKNEPVNVHHVRRPLDPGVKKSVETYFTEPGQYTPEPLPEKRMPDFENEVPHDGMNSGIEREKFQGKFDRNPTPLPPKDADFEDDSMADDKGRKEHGVGENEFDRQLHTRGPVNMDDLKLNYVPSEDSIKPARPLTLVGNSIGVERPISRGDERDKKRRSKERHRHKSGESGKGHDRDKRHDRKHRSRDNSRERDRHDRDRHGKDRRHRSHDRDRDRDTRRRHSRSRHHSSRSPDRHRSDHERRSTRSDRRRRSQSADRSRSKRRQRSRSRSSTSSSTSPSRPPPRQQSVPIVTRPSSGEDSAFQSTSLPQPYLSDSDHHPRNLQINSEIQISYPQRPPQPPGTAGTQLPLYTTSIPAPPNKPN